MNNAELDKLLQAVPVPERDAGFWDEFPKRITRRLNGSRASVFRRSASPRVAKWAWAWGLAGACVVAGFILGSWRSRVAAEQHQLANLQKCFREIAALFPNQLQAIVLDERGPRLVLSDTPNVPMSDPLFVKICRERNCQTFITFSGQQISVNGEVFDVLSDGAGHVILAGRSRVWSSGDPQIDSVPWRIEARPLPL
jgi:hypothetical protein